MYVRTMNILYIQLYAEENKVATTYSGNNFGIETVATPCHKGVAILTN